MNMRFLAQQQASRDYEIQKLQGEVERLTKSVAETTRQRDQNAAKVSELSKLESKQKATEARGGVNMDYLKNIMVKYVSTSSRFPLERESRKRKGGKSTHTTAHRQVH